MHGKISKEEAPTSTEMLVRLKKGKTTYEVLVHEGMVQKYREGTVTRLDDVAAISTVFVDANRGIKASSDQLKSAFDTEDMEAAVDIILRTGEAQESAAERKEKMDAKRQEIITSIQKNYVSPDGHRLPAGRIENALSQIKTRIDVDVDADRQAAALHDKLTAVLPMKKGAGGMEGTVTVPASLSGVVSGVVRKHATVHRETYGDQVKYFLEIFSYDLLMKDLSRVTKGDFQISLVTAPATNMVAAHSEDGDSSGKKKKGKGHK